MPTTNEFQINKGEKTLATVPYQWTTNTWTRLKFSTTRTPDGKFKIQGKAWQDGKEEPKDFPDLLRCRRSAPARPAHLLVHPLLRHSNEIR